MSGRVRGWRWMAAEIRPCAYHPLVFDPVGIWPPAMLSRTAAIAHASLLPVKRHRIAILFLRYS